MRIGSKKIYHLEAWVVKVMSLYKVRVFHTKFSLLIGEQSNPSINSTFPNSSKKSIKIRCIYFVPVSILNRAKNFRKRSDQILSNADGPIGMTDMIMKTSRQFFNENHSDYQGPTWTHAKALRLSCDYWAIVLLLDCFHEREQLASPSKLCHGGIGQKRH
jgi:hypothetical protein